MTHKNAHSSHALTYRPDIDGLRAIAVLAVVAFHAFPQRLKGGFIGVDIFFVISGFLITNVIAKEMDQNTFNLGAFYARRVRRIFPALLLVMGSCLVWGWFGLIPQEYASLGKHTASGASFVSNFILWRESGYFDAAAETKPLLHLWSLAIEEQFYLFWPLMLWFVVRKGLNRLSMVALYMIVSLGLNLWIVRHNPTAAFYAPCTRFWELGMGAGLALLQSSKMRNSFETMFLTMIWERPSPGQTHTLKNISAFLGATFIALGFMVITREKAFPGFWALLPVIGATLIISAGPEAWLNRVFLSHRLPVSIGLISYPLYLWHWPLLVFAHLYEEPYGLSASYRLIIVLFSFCLSWTTMKYIEHPIRFGCLKKNNKLIFSLIFSCIFIFCFGLFLKNKNGFVNRFPDDIKNLLTRDFLEEYFQDARVGKFHIGSDKKFEDIREEEEPGSRKTIYLWGDSHAAHLYPGLKKIIGEKFFVIQRTKSSCRPFIERKGIFKDEDFQKECEIWNNSVFKDILQKKPDLVLLAGSWPSYSEVDCVQEIDILTRRLSEKGVKNIVVLGPTPRWRGRLPRLMVKSYIRGKDIYKNTFFGIKEGLKSYDENFIIIKNKNFVYVSVLDFFLNKDGFLAMIPDPLKGGYVTTAYDESHLTTAGSIFIISKLSSFLEKLAVSNVDQKSHSIGIKNRTKEMR